MFYSQNNVIDSFVENSILYMGFHFLIDNITFAKAPSSVLEALKWVFSIVFVFTLLPEDDDN